MLGIEQRRELIETFTGYGIVGGINIVMIAMLCGQYDILYASLKNLATAVSLDDSQQVVEFR